MLHRRREAQASAVMSWLNPWPGPRSDPSWLVPSASVQRSSSLHGLHPAAGRRRSPVKQEQLDWLQPSAGRASIEGASSKRRRAQGPQPDWCNPPPGAEASCSQCSASTGNEGIQRSVSTSDPGVRRIHLDLVSLLMINSKAEKQTIYQMNGPMRTGSAGYCRKAVNVELWPSSNQRTS